MGLNSNYSKNPVFLEDTDKQGLLIPSIHTWYDLAEFEQYNIERAVEWSMSRKWTQEQILLEKFIKDVHYRMFNEVWSWAGEYRVHKPIQGVDWYLIPASMDFLIGMADFWLEDFILEPDMLAIQVKHKLHRIHAFTDGNDRHSRLFADILIHQLFQRDAFSWGRASSNDETLLQQKYSEALKAADRGIYNPLLEFARS